MYLSHPLHASCTVTLEKAGMTSTSGGKNFSRFSLSDPPMAPLLFIMHLKTMPGSMV